MIAGRIKGFVKELRKERKRRRRRLTRVHDDWSIGILTGDSPLSLTSPAYVGNPVLTGADVTDVRAAYVADPFLLPRAGGEWLLFFEVYNRLREKGEIGAARSADGLRWSYERIVLSEPFHLSYPYVFEWEGEVYLVPESHEAGSVRLYRARELPHRWEFVTTLVEGEMLVDPSLFRHEGRWWLLVETNQEPRRWDTLRLFGADRLEGPWLEHPQSPVVLEPHRARPAGRVIKWQGRPFRFAQVCDPDYGTAVRAFEILELSPTAYREREAAPGPVLEPGAGWRSTGMHHVDAHRLGDGSWLACVDGCGKRASGMEVLHSEDFPWGGTRL